MLLLVNLLIGRHLIRINIQIARSYLFGHSAGVIFHGRLGCNWFGTDHHAAIDSIVLVDCIGTSLLVDESLGLILLLLKYDLVVITQMNLHVRQLLLLFLHHQILYSTLVDFYCIRSIYSYFGCAGGSKSLLGCKLGLSIWKLLRLRYWISIIDSLVAFTNVGISVHFWSIRFLTLSLLLLLGRLFRKDNTTLAISTVFISLFLLRLAGLSVLLLGIRVVDW